MESISGLVAEPGGWFVASATASMVGGVFFLVWLSELITRHGIGNGLALILAVGILAALPADVANVIEVLRTGAVSPNLVLFHAVIWVAFVALIVLRRERAAERAARVRRSPARQALAAAATCRAADQAQQRRRVDPGDGRALALVAAAGGCGLRRSADTPWLVAAYEHMTFGRPAHLVLGAVAIFVLVFIYTAYVLDPEQAAATLQEQGGVIAGVEPGEPTADYLDRTVSLTTVLGAAYLTARVADSGAVRWPGATCCLTIIVVVRL